MNGLTLEEILERYIGSLSGPDKVRKNHRQTLIRPHRDSVRDLMDGPKEFDLGIIEQLARKQMVHNLNVFFRLLSFAMVARDHNYVKPKILDDQVIDIKCGRHPLKEILGTFIPNDTLSGNGSSLVKILTGPNASGKSIYLKQVALIVFMAHIGSFVPAESATIGIVTHILTQINSVDSLELNTSSFLLGLRQVRTTICQI